METYTHEIVIHDQNKDGILTENELQQLLNKLEIVGKEGTLTLNKMKKPGNFMAKNYWT